MNNSREKILIIDSTTEKHFKETIIEQEILAGHDVKLVHISYVNELPLNLLSEVNYLIICACDHPDELQPEVIELIHAFRKMGYVMLTQIVFLKIINVFDALGYVPDGATHIEAFLTQDNRIVFLEIAARAPGGWIPQMHTLCSGSNIEEQHFRSQMGQWQKPVPQSETYAAWVWYPHREGECADLTKVINIANEYKTVWEVKQGSPLVRPQSVRDRIGGILLWGSCYSSLKEDYQWLVDKYIPYQRMQQVGNEVKE